MVEQDELTPENQSESKLTTPEGVVSLMKSSSNVGEWNVNCDRVKAANNGDYPEFWFEKIMVGGVYDETANRWQSE